MLNRNTKRKMKWLGALVLPAMVGLTHAETLTRGPYLQNGAIDGATVMWRTDSAVAGKVWYGTTQGSLSQSVTGGSATDHSIRVTGLTPGTKYYYKIGNDAGGILAGDDASHYFITHPAVGSTEDIRIWAIGDSGTQDNNARAVRDAYLELASGSSKADVFLMLGDNAYGSGTDNEYQTGVFENMYEDILKNTILWSTQGNHDAYSNNVYLGIFDLPQNGEGGGLASGSEHYYSFDYGNIHFVCLSSEQTSLSNNAGSAMYTWLNNDLAATNQEWIIAFFHHPPYTKGSHDSDNSGDSSGRMLYMREIALPLLEAGGVDLVLSGHSHSYERSKFINGHYDVSSTFNAVNHVVQSGNGSSDGPYQKNGLDGAIYIVAGSSGKNSGSLTQHAAMESWINQLGSVVIDVSDTVMEVSFLREFTGPVQIDDQFTITHGPVPPSAPKFTYDPFSTADGFIDTPYSDNMSSAAKDLNGDPIAYAKISGPTWLSVAADGTLSGTPTVSDMGWNSFVVSASDVDGATNATMEILVRDPIASLAHWMFDEGAGTVAGDSSGNYDATITGATWSSGFDGNALSYDGVDDELSVSGFNFNSDSATFTAWINPSVTQTPWSGIIIDRSTVGAGLTFGSAGELRYMWNGVNWAWNSGLIPPLNTWTFVVLVVEPTKATIYMNSGSGFQSAENVVVHSADTLRDFYIGSDPDRDRFFDGVIDEVKIYDRALSTVELEDMHTEYTGGTSNNSPMFTVDPISKSDATQDAAYLGQSLAGSATDADSDPLSYSKLSGPAWLSVASDGQLSGTPANGNVGLNAFTVQASDGNGGADQATLNITVLNINDAPVFTADPINAPDATVSAAYSDTIASSATDPDSDSLSYSKVSGPAWLSVSSNGDLSGTPAAGDLGVNTFSVQVSDGNGGTDTAALSITVAVAGPEVLFSDNFDNGNVNNWTTSGSVSAKSNSSFSGTHGAEIKASSSMERIVSTVGRTSITVEYDRKTAGFDSGENLTLEWSIDGSAWNALESTSSTTWGNQSWALPVGAEGQSGFRIRITTNANRKNEKANVDNVIVSGI